jgi:hypothetical protein
MSNIFYICLLRDCKLGPDDPNAIGINTSEIYRSNRDNTPWLNGQVFCLARDGQLIRGRRLGSLLARSREHQMLSGQVISVIDYDGMLSDLVPRSTHLFLHSVWLMKSKNRRVVTAGIPTVAGPTQFLSTPVLRRVSIPLPQWYLQRDRLS